MSWDSEKYNDIVRVVVDIYEDYNITTFPVSASDLCNKMGIELVPYSKIDVDSTKLSNDAFFIPPTIEYGPKILYNDKVESKGRIRFSVFHEIKHYVCGDDQESSLNEDLANYFARFIMCPIPYLIYKNIDNACDIKSKFLVSDCVSYIVETNIKNRRRKYGNEIFDFEEPLIELLEGAKLNEC